MAQDRQRAGRRTRRISLADRSPAKVDALKHATRLIRQVCRGSGFLNVIGNARRSLREQGVAAAVPNHDTAVLFDWLIAALSYQGISDQIAADYMERYGQATWRAIETDLQRRPSCPKLRSYWHFHDCRYSKSNYSCAEPSHLAHCPLPNHWLRNGRLNQTAFSLYLFIRDVAGSDLVGWTLQFATGATGRNRVARRELRSC